MKQSNKLSKYGVVAVLALMGLMPSCQDPLSAPNRGAIVPEAVWGDPIMISAFLNNIYSGLMPGWPINGGDTDEGISTAKSLGAYQRGQIGVASTTSDLNYTHIEKINFFLDKLETVPASVLSDALKKQYSGEVLFWRAWSYWGMVKQVGGVPLILKPQNAVAVNDLFVPRNKTSECVAQIIKDLDTSISSLSPVYEKTQDLDYGRITKVAAAAVKGRVLMTYASPLFNPSNNPTRWQAAYEANKAAFDIASAAGHDLHPKFQDIWTQERNKEVIMVNQYAYPNHTVNFNLIRPEAFTKDASNTNQPLLSLLLSFPKKDGSPMQFDKDRLADDAYNTQFMTDFYTNRDDRFYATIFFGGKPYPTPDEIPLIYVKGDSYWNVWQYNADTGLFINITNKIHPGLSSNPGLTGFFQLKGVDITLVAALVAQGGTDWIEIRFAEVIMNYAECANEIGRTTEAIDLMKSIRKRAGIAEGNGSYGITASSQAEIREALIKERQAEFAFESKRFDDLRRWKRYDILNNQGARHGLRITIKDINNLPKRSDNIMTDAVRAKFRAYYVDNLDGDDTFKFNFDLNHWFYALKPSQIAQSKNILLQNKEWGGSFDPLE